MCTRHAAFPLVALFSVAVTLAACAEDPADLTAVRGEAQIAIVLEGEARAEDAIVGSAFGQDLGSAPPAGDRKGGSWILLQTPSGESPIDLPDLREAMRYELNGVRGANYGGTDEPHHMWGSAVELAASAVPEAGQLFTLTLDVPDNARFERTIRMVAPTTIVGPAPGSELSRHADVEVTWAEAEEGTADWVIFSVIEGSSPSIMTEVPQAGLHIASEGATSASFTGAEMGEVYDAFMADEGTTAGIPAGSPVYAEVRLFRERTVSNAPDFKEGTTRLIVELARSRVVFSP